MGFCPSGRMFEAAACGVPLLSDRWARDRDLLPAGAGGDPARWGPADTVAALGRTDAELRRIAEAARERTPARSRPTGGRSSSSRRSTRRHRRPPAVLYEGAVRCGPDPGRRPGHAHPALGVLEELLPVGGRDEAGTLRPRAVSEYLVERLRRGGADRIAFVVAPGKTDILEY